MRSPTTLAVGGLAAAICGAAAWFGLSALAAPAHFGSDRDRLDATVARLERTVDTARRSPVHGPNTACPSPGDADLAVMKQGLMTMASQTGAPLTDLVATPAMDSTGVRRLTPVALRLQAVGPYENVRALLERLAEAQPEIFVDQLDLTSAAPNVKLKLTGKVFCWTSARP